MEMEMEIFKICCCCMLHETNFTTKERASIGFGAWGLGWTGAGLDWARHSIGACARAGIFSPPLYNGVFKAFLYDRTWMLLLLGTTVTYLTYLHLCNISLPDRLPGATKALFTSMYLRLGCT